jgi:hypothetical protein
VGSSELLATRTDLPSDAVARLEKVSGQTDKADVRDPPRRGVFPRAAGRTALRGSGERGGPDAGPARSTAWPAWGRGDGGPWAERDYRVRADERQLTQALLNLVLNAEEALGILRQPSACR